MGFLDFLFKKKTLDTNEPIEDVWRVKEGAVNLIPFSELMDARNLSQEVCVCALESSEDYDRFYDKHYDKWLERYENILDVDDSSSNPDKTVKNFEKALLKSDEFKEKLCSVGPNGKKMYKEEFDDLRDNIMDDYKLFMENDYQELKNYYEENKAFEAAVKKECAAILKIISSSDGPVSQVELKKQFENYDVSISRLEDKGKIKRQKINGRVYFTTEAF